DPRTISRVIYKGSVNMNLIEVQHLLTDPSQMATPTSVATTVLEVFQNYL
ncbi:hypothetical protein Bpfe_021845, partial [Biomphalaria pfeifferi]